MAMALIGIGWMPTPFGCDVKSVPATNRSIALARATHTHFVANVTDNSERDSLLLMLVVIVFARGKLPEYDLAVVELSICAGRVRKSLTWLGTDRQTRGCIEQLEVNVATAMESGGIGMRQRRLVRKQDLLFSQGYSLWERLVRENWFQGTNQQNFVEKNRGRCKRGTVEQLFGYFVADSGFPASNSKNSLWVTSYQYYHCPRRGGDRQMNAQFAEKIKQLANVGLAIISRDESRPRCQNITMGHREDHHQTEGNGKTSRALRF